MVNRPVSLLLHTLLVSLEQKQTKNPIFTIAADTKQNPLYYILLAFLSPKCFTYLTKIAFQIHGWLSRDIIALC